MPKDQRKYSNPTIIFVCGRLSMQSIRKILRFWMDENSIECPCMEGRAREKGESESEDSEKHYRVYDKTEEIQREKPIFREIWWE